MGASCLLDKNSTVELQPQPMKYYSCLYEIHCAHEIFGVNIDGVWVSATETQNARGWEDHRMGKVLAAYA